MNRQAKSKQRIADHGEVFTAEREVNAMLDLVKQETERIDSRFLEPACGNGNFLAEILRRKLAVVKSRYGKNADDYERYAIIAVTSIYGVEILQDNAQECRERLFDIWNTEYTRQCKTESNDETRAAVRFILEKNILCGDALTLEQADGTPIIFAEWSAVNGTFIKRRDFELSHMLHAEEKNLQMDLFGSVGNYETDASGATVLMPIREFPPIHYRRVKEHG
ncbi:MAG: SAM-dependent DNA methyltransferase [Trichococcus flocculiformis]|uniref:SAM-dependent DNA methyltransferase n=1 Tax=Trichococcus flocculiformis TaxID=82803 RepID=A0A847D1F3_9LACT|nr:DNA methyltransferase [Trichococcus flocculiformis]NLD31161.1 SAM-dependent DNA methyltransferase [Trichococcus flocculiformis]